jgi:outer membrane protein OmpA-like peptidoglycan-associated protein
MTRQSKTSLAVYIVVLAFVWCAPVAAQKALTSEEILNGLQNSASSQSLTADEVLNSLENSLVVESTDSTLKVPTEKTQDVIASLPTLDFQIYFDYNSASIKPQSIPTLMALGRALSSGELANQKFLIAGHTDAAGSNAYNLALSQRRAASVVEFLDAAFDLRQVKLVPLGFGEEQLANTYDPSSEHNRRVQVVNLGKM